MSDFFDKIKKQIEKQTLPDLNIKMTRPRSAKFVEENKPETDQPEILTPEWTKQSYVFERGTDFAIIPDKFNNYYGKIEKSYYRTDDSGINDVSLVQYSNVRYSIKIYSSKVVNFILEYECKLGNVYISTTPEDEDEIIWVSSNSQVTKGSFRLSLSSDKWITLQILYYSSDSSPSLYLGPGLKDHITNWTYTDTTAPDHPTWASPAIETELLDPQTGTAKVILYWNKNIESDFAGNGVYRSSTKASGVSVAGDTDPLLISNSFYCLGSVWGTILCGASIQISGIGTTWTVKAVDYRPPNLKTNGDFRYGWTGWDKSSAPSSVPTFTRTSYILGTKSVSLITSATNQLCSITTSDYMAVATSDYYRIFYHSSYNLVSNEGFELGTINKRPNIGWVTGVYAPAVGTVILATIGAIFGNNLCKIVRCDEYSVIRTDYFSLKNGQDIVFSCYASTNTGGAKVTIWKINADIKVIDVPPQGKFSLITGTAKADQDSNQYTLALGYYGTDGTNGNTIWFDQASVYATFSKLNTRTRVSYYNSGFGACATVYEDFSLAKPNLWERNSVILSRSSETGPGHFPNNCSYIKTSFNLENLSTATSIYSRLLMGGIYIKKGIEIYSFNPTIHGASFVQVDKVIPIGLSGLGVNQIVYDHLHDRNVEPTDGAIISWEDAKVQNGITYKYVLDAYDTESNRSLYSPVASIVAGDVIPPLPITGLQGQAGYKLVSLNWTNPTAADYQGAKIYVNGTQADNLKTKEYGPPGEKDSVVVGGLSDEVLYNFYVTSFDRNNNENRSVFPSVQITTLGAPVLYSSVSVVLQRYDDGSDRYYYCLGTFNIDTYTENAVLVVNDINVSIKDSNNTEMFSGNLHKIGTGPTIHCAGSFCVSGANPEGIAYIYVNGTDKESRVFQDNSSFIVDKTIPIISGFNINDGAIFTYNPVTKLSLSSSTDVWQMKFRNDAGDWSSWIKYGDTYSWKIPDIFGIATVQTRVRDWALNESITASNQIRLVDSLPLGGSIYLDDDDRRYYSVGTFNFLFFNNEAIFATINDFHMSMKDVNGSNISVSKLHFKNFTPTRNILGSFRIQNTTPENYVNVFATGTTSSYRKVYVADSFLVDRTVPNISSLLINDGDSVTNSPAVKLTIVAQGTPNEMKFRNESGLWAPWVPFGEVYSWNLSQPANAMKTVSAIVRDLALNESNTGQEQIFLAVSAPTLQGTFWIQDDNRREFSTGTFDFHFISQAVYATINDVHITVKDSSSNSLRVGGLRFLLSNPTRNVLGSMRMLNTTPENYANMVATGTTIDGRKVSGEDVFLVDRTVPVLVYFAINKGDTYTTSRNVVLSISASGNPHQMKFWKTGELESGMNWIPFASIHSWGLSEGYGTKTVSARIRDLARNQLAIAIIDTITYVGSTPPDIAAIWWNQGKTSQIFQNEFNWFNQIVYATLQWSHKVSSNAVASLSYRRKYGSSSWTSWYTTGTNNFVGTLLNYDGTIQFECWAKDMGGNKSETKTYTLFQDKVNPLINDTGLWSDNCRSRIKGAFLEWNPVNLTDALSGMAYTRIYRKKVSGTSAGTLLDRSPYGSGFYADEDYSLLPFETYYYRLRGEDKAGNLSSVSSEKDILIYPNWKEEFANWIDNSSFERIGYDGQPENWSKVGAPSTISPGYSGGHAVRVNEPNYYRTVYTYLPAYDSNRNFVLSYFAKKGDSAYPQLGVLGYIRFYRSDNSLMSSPSLINRTIGTVTSITTWKRLSTLVAAASIPSNASYCRIRLWSNYDDELIDADCIQWEEKVSLPASDYVETRSISGDRVMAHFIRGDMIEAESIRSTEISAYAITATHLSANSVVVEGGKLAQIRIGETTGYHTLLKNRAIFFKKGTQEFGYVRRAHWLEHLQCSTIIKYENYSIPSFDTSPKIFLFPESVKTYESSWSAKDQYIALYSDSVTPTHFMAKAMLYGGVELQSKNANYSSWQDGNLALRPGGVIGTAMYVSQYDVLIYGFNATANKMDGYLQLHWYNPTGTANLYIRVRTIIGEYSAALGKMTATLPYQTYWYYGYHWPTGTYVHNFTPDITFTLATTYDVKVSIATFNGVGWPVSNLNDIKITNYYYMSMPSIQEQTSALVDALVMET